MPFHVSPEFNDPDPNEGERAGENHPCLGWAKKVSNHKSRSKAGGTEDPKLRPVPSINLPTASTSTSTSTYLPNFRDEGEDNVAQNVLSF